MVCGCFRSLVERRSISRAHQDGEGNLMQHVNQFSYNELRSATDNFHLRNNIGRGGFGTVYKAWELHKEGKLLDLVDPDIGEFPEEEVTRYMKVAFFCTQAAASRRPLMSQVVDMISRKILLNEKELTPPGFFQGSTTLGAVPSSTKMSLGESTSSSC
ncbi:LRR receptor-like serine/threonine-protein kinase [Tripterygium wilfordii]|uniref:LRR receptor-like serine/threonine-protein kinase n=1 Tax=Tripterygium wilfordii TaxID=458696 RepID=A0A7J7C474_TRIWF|nr:LRR receptor-like serine/threonine-protein kinase [Tripterygium wilfordii]